MTVKRKKKGGFSGGRTVTVAFSLCLLAVVTMIGMYTVGRTDQQQKELEQQVAEAEEEARAREQAQAEAEKAAKEAEKSEETEELADAEKTQEAASGSASRDKAGEAAADAAGETAGTEGTGMADGAELESEFAEIDPEGTGETVILDGTEEASSADAVSEQMDLSFSPETDQLLWPVAGNVIMDYSMDKTVYFATLDQYKYNPAVIIQGTLDENVMSAAPGQVTKIETLEETGMTVTMDIGDGYELVYGQLKELPVNLHVIIQKKAATYISKSARTEKASIL